MELRDKASLVLGFRLPTDSNKWEPAIKAHIGGDIDANKKWNMTIMLLMHLAALEEKKK